MWEWRVGPLPAVNLRQTARNRERRCATTILPLQPYNVRSISRIGLGYLFRDANPTRWVLKVEEGGWTTELLEYINEWIDWPYSFCADSSLAWETIFTSKLLSLSPPPSLSLTLSLCLSFFLSIYQSSKKKWYAKVLLPIFRTTRKCFVQTKIKVEYHQVKEGANSIQIHPTNW